MWLTDEELTKLANLLLMKMKIEQAKQNAEATRQKSNFSSVPRRLISVREGSIYLGMSVSALQHLIHRKQIPVVRVGRRTLLDPKVIEGWIQERSSR